MPRPSLRPGDRIAQGNTSDVWPWTPRTVIKVLHPGIPRHWAAIEADIVRRVHAAGLPVPATEGVVEIDGRVGVVLERIDGETMWEQMKASSPRIPDLVRVLVDLQADLHATTVEGLPDLARRLASKIDEAVQLSAADRRTAQSMLAALPSGASLCHGDVHPANIVMTSRGVVVLDWFDAASGFRAADMVRSSLLMRPPSQDAAERHHLSGATRGFLDLLHCSYLDAIVRREMISSRDFAAWEVVVSVARMAEPVPTEDLIRLWHEWKQAGAADATAMIERCLERVTEADAPGGLRG